MKPEHTYETLLEREFEFLWLSHAEAILKVDFPDAIEELLSALVEIDIPIEEIVGSGGGEAKGTQRLRRALSDKGWNKVNFTIEKRINGEAKESISHEVDHVKKFPNGVIALEIEWNNKDPFFDRDLENFKRLHAEGAISIGIIVTRGTSLQDAMRDLVLKFIQQNNISTFDGLAEFGYTPTARQKNTIIDASTRSNNPLSFEEAFVRQFVSDKFGAATTHWSKLEDRVKRGVGNPCPLVLVGLPASIVSFE